MDRHPRAHPADGVVGGDVRLKAGAPHPALRARGIAVAE